MKKMLLSLFLLFTCFSYSQNFIPMLEDGNAWSVDVLNYPDQSWTLERFSVGPIETVNGKEYKRIMLNDYAACLLREEEGIVYKYDENTKDDKILFDFTLEEGNVFPLVNSAYDLSAPFCSNFGSSIFEDFLTVQSVEYITIAGTLRKVITFNENNPLVQFKWIEGIGNNSGFDHLWEWIDITDGSKLSCFRTNGINYLFNDATICNILELEGFKENDIILFPNPITNISQLQLPIEAEIDLLKIFNITGKLIKEEKVISDHVLIDAMQYASGLYFYQVFSVSKLIKTDKFIVN